MTLQAWPEECFSRFIVLNVISDLFSLLWQKTEYHTAVFHHFQIFYRQTITTEQLTEKIIVSTYSVCWACMLVNGWLGQTDVHSVWRHSLFLIVKNLEHSLTKSFDSWLVVYAVFWLMTDSAENSLVFTV